MQLRGALIRFRGFVVLKRLTIKVLIATTANDTLKYFLFSEKIRLGISCELSA